MIMKEIKKENLKNQLVFKTKKQDFIIFFK